MDYGRGDYSSLFFLPESKLTGVLPLLANNDNMEEIEDLRIYPCETEKSWKNTIRFLAAWLLIGFITVCLLSSCRSIKYVPVETVRHDSIYIHHTDTVSTSHTIHEKEYIEIKDSSSVVVDSLGNVIKQIIWHNKTIIRSMSDSLLFYKSRADSLANIKSDTITIVVEVEKPLTTWQHRFISIGKVASGLVGGLLIFGIVWLVFWIKKKATSRLHAGSFGSRPGP